MKFIQLFSFFYASVFFALTAYALDITKESMIQFDFSKLSITSQGIFNPKNENEKNGLKAEMIARKDGIDAISQYLNASCEGVDKNTIGLKNGWENSFKSQGTEIYANGYLLVSLQAAYKSVIKLPSKLKQTIKTKEGQKIVFSIPTQIPAAAVKCGTIELVVESDSSKRIHIMPGETISEAGSKAVLVKLVYDEKGYVKPRLDSDITLLLESNLFSESSEVKNDLKILPLTFLVTESN